MSRVVAVALVFACSADVEDPPAGFRFTRFGVELVIARYKNARADISKLERELGFVTKRIEEDTAALVAPTVAAEHAAAEARLVRDRETEKQLQQHLRAANDEVVKLSTYDGVAILQHEDYTRQMCACTDSPCANHIQGAYSRWGSAVELAIGLERKPPDADFRERTARAATQYTECYTRIVMRER